MNESAFTAILFVGTIAAVIPTVTNPACCDAASCVVAPELIITTCYTHKQTTHSNCCWCPENCFICNAKSYILVHSWLRVRQLVSCKAVPVAQWSKFLHFASAYLMSFQSV